DAALIETLQNVPHQRCADALSALIPLDKHQADPCDLIEHAAARGADRLPGALGDEAARRFEIELATPVRFELVPAVLRRQVQAERNVVSGQRADVHRSKIALAFAYWVAYIDIVPEAYANRAPSCATCLSHRSS